MIIDQKSVSKIRCINILCHYEPQKQQYEGFYYLAQDDIDTKDIPQYGHLQIIKTQYNNTK